MNNNQSTSLHNRKVIKKRVEYCFVPMCESTSTLYPNKLFISGPSNPKLRELWFKAVGRTDKFSPKTVIRCCEDHFDLEKDVANWIKYKLCGGSIFLKKNVVPHIFECQSKVKPSELISILKRKRHKEAMDLHTALECPVLSANTASGDFQNTAISNDESIELKMDIFDEEFQENTNVCRVCLAMDVKMCDLMSNPMQTYFETVVGPVISTMKLPLYLCYECAALVKKFSLFKERCLRGQSALYSILQSTDKFTKVEIKQIDRKQLQLCSNLSIASCRTEMERDYTDDNLEHTEDNLKHKK